MTEIGQCVQHGEVEQQPALHHVGLDVARFDLVLSQRELVEGMLARIAVQELRSVAGTRVPGLDVRPIEALAGDGRRTRVAFQDEDQLADDRRSTPLPHPLPFP